MLTLAHWMAQAPSSIVDYPVALTLFQASERDDHPHLWFLMWWVFFCKFISLFDYFIINYASEALKSELTKKNTPTKATKAKLNTTVIFLIIFEGGE